LKDAFRVSSNIVTGKMANVVGGERLRLWAIRFGFGTRTGIRLPAEKRGSVPKHRWSEYMTAAFSIGHGVSVTTLQLATAYAALANGGLLLEPYLVRSATSVDGEMVYRRSPKIIRRVLSPEVAATLQQMCQTVVKDGTAKPAYDPVYELAGKTGTAEKPDHQTKTMIKNKYIASFAGFWPADNPRLVGVVVLDEPEPIHYGGWTAAPMLLNMFKRGSCGEMHQEIPAHPTKGNRQTADGVFAANVSASPAATPTVQTATSFWTHQDNHAVDSPTFDDYTMPDLTGCVARTAVHRLKQMGLAVHLEGAGTVIRQTPKAGTNMEMIQRCELVLR
jgi:cell division protein FtsI (penicillin-binding protein 3)